MDKWPNFHFSLTEDKLGYFHFQVMVRRLLVVGWRSWIVAHTEASSLPPVSRRLSSRGDLSRDRFAISKHLQWNELLSFVLSQILWISLCFSCSSQRIRLPSPPPFQFPVSRCHPQGSHVPNPGLMTKSAHQKSSHCMSVRNFGIGMFPSGNEKRLNYKVGKLDKQSKTWFFGGGSLKF